MLHCWTQSDTQATNRLHDPGGKYALGTTVTVVYPYCEHLQRQGELGAQVTM